MSVNIHTSILTLFALIAFAGNSIVCRLALADGSIDATSFSVVRILSACFVLFSIVRIRRQTSLKAIEQSGSWLAGFMLFVYVAAFSYAYIELDTGFGALVLFTSVQATMIAISLIQGNRLNRMESAGALLAFCGFIYLVAPNRSAGSFDVAMILMMVSGIAWGVYSTIGKSSEQPVNDTTGNFVRALAFVVILAAVTILYDPASIDISNTGIVLAAISGGITSAIGYVIWYWVLPKLSLIVASLAQLFVPAIAALGGVVLVGEALTRHLVLSSLLIVTGIVIVIVGRNKSSSDKR